MSLANLLKWFNLADQTDKAEAKLSYARYHQVIKTMAGMYGIEMERAVAAFVSLSPSNDYFGNLRSTASVLEAVANQYDPRTLVVSSYKHCGKRAFEYASGQKIFLTHTKGLKITNFYHNILDPSDPNWVTIDGHIVGAAKDKPLRMKDALVSVRDYREIKGMITELSKCAGLVPNQVQAAIWFARKRILGIKYEPQLGLFQDATDAWNTVRYDIRPYERRLL